MLVPKRFGWGYTLNFASGWAWVVMGGLFAVLAMGAVVAVVSGT
ncbi:MAG TPA: DUF5808 domain-containing protein [Terriglobales bacterium]|nr:DUF5808 domain-containing protein [Terriglobales bacterium]